MRKAAVIMFAGAVLGVGASVYGTYIVRHHAAVKFAEAQGFYDVAHQESQNLEGSEREGAQIFEAMNKLNPAANKSDYDLKKDEFMKTVVDPSAGAVAFTIMTLSKDEDAIPANSELHQKIDTEIQWWISK